MTAAHFRTDAELAARFDELAGTDPFAAVRHILATDYAIARADVPTPVHDAVSKLHPHDRQARLELMEQNSRAWVSERRAVSLAIAEGDPSKRTRNIARTHDREALIAARAAELEGEYFAKLRAEWRAQAEREIEGAPAASSEPEPKKVRRSAA